jgi:hypothetical protein
MKRPKPKPKASKRTYAKPLSLHPMSFEQAVDTLLAHKPTKKVTRKKSP